MANPTTYFGWVMPTSSSLVTNLPADFNTFGQGVDTSLQYLLGGTTGQVLSKTSGTNMAFTWVTPTDQTPLTTKGDLFAFSTVDARLPAGANETRLVADSAQTLGLKYVADTTNYAIAAKADLLVGTAADTLAALTVGTDGQVLTADSTVSPTGVKWATPAGGSTFYGCQLQKSVSQSTANNTSTALTFQTESVDVGGYHTGTSSKIIIPTGKGGTYLFTGQVSWATAASGLRLCSFYKNGSIVATGNSRAGSTTWDTTTGTLIITLVAGDEMELYGRQNSGGSLDVVGEDSDNYITRFGCVLLGA